MVEDDGRRGDRSALAIAALPFAIFFVCGCGRAPPEVSGASDTGTTTLTSTSAADVGVTTDASAEATTAAPATTESTTATTSGVDDTGTTGRPRGECDHSPPVELPRVPDGCEGLWLVHKNGDLLDGEPSGLVQCPDPQGGRVVYRLGVVACRAEIDGDCRCDADCALGEACICANEWTSAPGLGFDVRNRCFPSDCASVDDCGGAMCRVDVVPCAGAWLPEALRCTTPGDECVFHSECDEQGLGICDYDETMELFTCEAGAICE
jgi:hypothetical protein